MLFEGDKAVFIPDPLEGCSFQDV